MKKVLIITYYWPPTGGVGVQRWLKTSKYLPEFGWEPIIYTPENPDINATDEILLKEISPEMKIIKRKITEPYIFYKKFIGQKRDSKIKSHLVADNPSSLKDKISVFIRGNFFIPDPRCWWIKPSAKFLSKYLKEHPVDLIVSTGPPHSMHIIAEKVSKNTGIKWIADFRDPWTEMFYYKQMRLTKIADRINHKMEQSVIDNADAVFVVTKEMKESFAKRTKTPIYIITNGFDHTDYIHNDCEKFESNLLPDKNRFNVVYTGLLSKNRDMKVLWRVLSEKANNDADFKEALMITAMGQTDSAVIDSIKEVGLANNFKDLDYAPHQLAIRWQKDANILLISLVESKEATAIIPAKFFEYLASGTPILSFGAVNGDLGDIMRETKCGKIVEFGDYDGTKSYIDQMYAEYLKDKTLHINRVHTLTDDVMRFSRKNLTYEMVKAFSKAIDK